MILVTDGQKRQTLTIVRSLGKKGLKVIVGDSDKISTSFFSKYTHKKFIYPDPKKNERAFIEKILQITKENEIELIIPVTDKCLIPIVKNQNLFPGQLYCNNYEKIMIARDKAQMLKFAPTIDIPRPKTYFLEETPDLNQINYPVVIKPRLSSGSRGIKKCNSQEDLNKFLPQIKRDYGEVIIQELIPQEGEEIGYYALLDEKSNIKAYTIQKRLRSYPISGGPSTYRETVKHDQIKELSEKILKNLNWRGVAMVEWKIDPRGNTPKLMEVNPRFWGSLALSVLAGVDFPFLLYQLQQNQQIPAQNYQIGVRCRWLLPGDILWFLSSKKNFANIKQFFFCKSNGDDMIDKSDLKPVFGFLLAATFYLFDKEKRKYIIR